MSHARKPQFLRGQSVLSYLLIHSEIQDRLYYITLTRKKWGKKEGEERGKGKGRGEEGRGGQGRTGEGRGEGQTDVNEQHI